MHIEMKIKMFVPSMRVVMGVGVKICSSIMMRNENLVGMRVVMIVSPVTH